jgi:hypothetical protein
MGKEEEADEREGGFFFYALDWITCGYKLTKISVDLMEMLEERKKAYMGDRGYVEEGTNGYDAGVARTARLWAKPVIHGKYKFGKSRAGKRKCVF